MSEFRVEDGIVWDISKDIMALPDDEFSVFCECFSDDRLPVGCAVQIIEKAKAMRSIRVV